MGKAKFTVSEDKKTLTVERSFDAPKDKIWEAYSDPKILCKWWGPKGWETQIKHMEFKAGGYWHYGMKCVDKAQGEWFGKVSWGKGVFLKIDPKDSFEYTDLFCDENGDPTPNMPASRSVLTLTERGGKTTLITKTTYEAPGALEQVLAMGMEEGYSQTLDNLEAVLSQ